MTSSNDVPARRARWKRPLFIGAAILLTLFVPMPEPRIEAHGGTPFVWDADEEWEQLREHFESRRESGCESLNLNADLAPIRAALATIESASPRDRIFETTQQRFFRAAADAAACPDDAPPLLALYSDLRAATKRASRAWRPEDRQARETLYRILYGGRLAIEEVMLQMPPDAMPVLLLGEQEASASPGMTLHDVEVHSGDLLVSRGGAPTSAMIARGNDFPGNFSHVALVHIEDGVFQTIESHIERGVVLAGLDAYERDAKLRVMLLRPRADLAEGDFAHRAASYSVARVQAGHIPYDFESDLTDNSEMFCSEVASDAYQHEDIYLWRGLTTMSGPGVARWLSRFGVRHFETHGPSDLEYDEQLVVVAEWRDAETLLGDHIDAAVMDAMLEGADEGEALHLAWWKLPFARMLKAYSWVKNVFGAEGPIPEGMSPQAGLRVEYLMNRHAELRAGVEQDIASFRNDRGYTPPFWELVEFARIRAGRAD